MADDEVDYNLWNPAHAQGSNFYGIIIENMPLVEAMPDETQVMRYKLVTLGKNSVKIPVISVAHGSLTFDTSGQSSIITPQTVNFSAGNAALGYTAILNDSDVVTLEVDQPLTTGITPSISFIGQNDSSQSVAVVGFTFKVIAKEQLIEDKSATIVITGNETGGRVSISILVKKKNILDTTVTDA